MLLFCNSVVAVNKSIFSGSGNTKNPITKNKKGQAILIHLIDSLLEKETINADEIHQLNFLNSLVKENKDADIYALIDALLEKDTINPAELKQLKFLSSLMSEPEPKPTETNIDDLDHIHFYSESDEKKLFPVYPLDSIAKEFQLVLENPVSPNYTNPFNGVITSYYGWRDKRMHKGIDIDLNKGEPVVSAFDGKVRIAEKNKGGFGNVVIIMHANGLETVYAHLSRIKVKPGQIVLSGQVIGLGGNTGRSRGSHLHFETRYKGYAINPLSFIHYSNNQLYHHSATIKLVKKELMAFPSNAELHTIKKGESWTMISQKYNVPIKTLVALNGSAKRYYLRPGNPLRVH